MSKFFKFPVSKITLLIIYTVFGLCVYNLNFWTNLHIIEPNWPVFFKLAIVISFLGLLLGYTFFLIFSLQKHLFKTILIIFTLINSLAAYFLNTYNVYLDKGMIENVLATNTQEALNLFNWWLLGYFIFLGVIPSILIYKCKIKEVKITKHFLKSILIFVLLFLLALGNLYIFSKEAITFARVNKELFNKQVPYSYIKNTIKYFKAKIKEEFIPVEQIDIKAKYNHERTPGQKGKIMVMVIGETARYNNFSLYGYERETNPLLKKEDLFVFTPKASCGTSTAVSLPCIFYPLGVSEFQNNKKNIKSYLHYLKDLKNLKIVWYDNNFGGCYENCTDIENYKTQTFKDVNNCKDGECVDGVFLSYFDKYIKESNEDLLLVFHQNGSHGPLYYKRYPGEFEKFTPTCKTSKPQNCTQSELINTYDNTILYNDFILSRLIGVLKNHKEIDSSLIYTSDHGESLGEYGIYLHGLPYGMAPDFQKNVPLLLWLSDKTKSRYNLKCIADKTKTKEQTHDEMVNSMFGFFNIGTAYYKPDHDIFANCLN